MVVYYAINTFCMNHWVKPTLLSYADLKAQMASRVQSKCERVSAGVISDKDCLNYCMVQLCWKNWGKAGAGQGDRRQIISSVAAGWWAHRDSAHFPEQSLPNQPMFHMFFIHVILFHGQCRVTFTCCACKFFNMCVFNLLIITAEKGLSSNLSSNKIIVSFSVFLDIYLSRVCFVLHRVTCD